MTPVPRSVWGKPATAKIKAPLPRELNAAMPRTRPCFISFYTQDLKLSTPLYVQLGGSSLCVDQTGCDMSVNIWSDPRSELSELFCINPVFCSPSLSLSERDIYLGQIFIIKYPRHSKIPALGVEHVGLPQHLGRPEGISSLPPYTLPHFLIFGTNLAFNPCDFTLYFLCWRGNPLHAEILSQSLPLFSC